MTEEQAPQAPQSQPQHITHGIVIGYTSGGNFICQPVEGSENCGALDVAGMLAQAQAITQAQIMLETMQQAAMAAQKKRGGLVVPGR